jgi:hypothetical protein
MTLALPKEVEHWSLTTLREKLVKISAKGPVSGNPAADRQIAAQTTSTMLNGSLESCQVTGGVCQMRQ